MNKYKKKTAQKQKSKHQKSMTVDIIDLTESGNSSNVKKKRIKKKRKRESKIGDEPSKKKKKLVIDLSEEYSVEDQIRYILHPVNVRRTIRNQLPVYQLNDFEVGGERKTLEWMDAKWEKSLKLKKMKRKEDLVEGCMLTWLNLLPPRTIQPKYVDPHFRKPDNDRILNFLKPELETPIRDYLSSNPSERDMLCTLLFQGVYFSKNLFSAKQVKVTSRVHDLFYDQVNKKMKSSYGVLGVRCANEIPFREFMFRGEPDDDVDGKTLDLSLMLGAVQCAVVPNYILNLQIVQAIKDLYSNIFPKSELRLVNCGFFQSPPGNDGQHWHTDESVNCVNETSLRMPELFTLVVALTDQSVDEFGSTGSTVFALGSHLPVDVARKLYTRGYDIVSPTLKKGDAAIFAGNLFHHGGAFKNRQVKDNRLLLYAVFHLLDKSEPLEATLKSDENISEIRQMSSFFGGRRWQISVNENDEVQIERCRRSLRRT